MEQESDDTETPLARRAGSSSRSAAPSSPTTAPGSTSTSIADWARQIAAGARWRPRGAAGFLGAIAAGMQRLGWTEAAAGHA
jgi:hypothetical protein